MTCQTNTMCAAGAGKCFSSALIAAHTAEAVSSSPTRFMLRELADRPLRPMSHRPVMAALVPATNPETVGQDRCGRSLARVSVADAANTALSFHAITGE